jgi:hypothetical protein
MNSDALYRLMLGPASTLLLAFACIGPAAAQTAAAPHVTRSVQVFTQFEDSLLQAAREHDAQRLEALVGEEFEMVVAQHPGSPVPREDWLAAMRKTGAGAYGVEGMSVREIGPVAIASFLLRPAPARADTVPVFIVDIWERASDTQWQLTTRHAAPAAGSRQSVPGDAKPKTIDKKI